jgi:hypothetical protein
MIGYWFSHADGTTKHQRVPAVDGRTDTCTGKLVPCAQGLHSSPTPWAALVYATGPMLWEVEVPADAVPHGDPVDKHAGRSRTYLRHVDLTSVCRLFALQQAALAAQAALAVSGRWSMPATVRALLTQVAAGEEYTAAAAYEAADAARTAADAAYAATYAAADAADAADAAAYAATYAAADAADAADAAAYAATYAAADAAYAADAAARTAAHAAYAADAAAYEAAYAATYAAADAAYAADAAADEAYAARTAAHAAAGQQFNALALAALPTT